jgi:hypothetical protein
MPNNQGELITGNYHYDDRWRTFTIATTYDGLCYAEDTVTVSVQRTRAGSDIAADLRSLAEVVMREASGADEWPEARLVSASGWSCLAPTAWCGREIASLLLLHGSDYLGRHGFPAQLDTLVLLDPDNRLCEALDRGFDCFSVDERIELEHLRRRNGL